MGLADYSSLIQSELRSVDVGVDETAIAQLAAYCEEVERWNRKINLTSLHDAALVRRLLVEPIWIARHLKIQGVVCDIGSGNGSPAIPIRLTQPIETLHLVEVRSKRAAFLRHLTSALRLDHAFVHRDRFENAAAAIGPVDWMTMQAVEPTDSILKAVRTVSKETTRVVWITSKSKTTIWDAVSVLEVPFSETKAVILSLDRLCT